MRQRVELDGRTVTVVGTSHVSEESRDLVKETIEEENPDLVAVELDNDRFDSLRNDSGWTDMDVADAIKNGKGYLLAVNLFLSIMQRRFAGDLRPGAEMLQAVELAEERGIELALVDRNINETFRRAREELTFTEKIKLIWSLTGLTEEMEVEDIAEKGVVQELVEELGNDYPSLKRTFLDERNTYMAEQLREREFENAVMVVGAAHLEGVVEQLKSEKEYSPVRKKTFPWNTVLKYGLPLFIIGGIGYSFWRIGFEAGVTASAAWIGINGVLALIGALIARAHPITSIATFFAAPLTSLDPAMGAGMVSGYIEAKIKPPKVHELESIVDIESYWNLWDNQVGRVILTFVFVTIGSAAATFISAGVVASLLAGA